MLYWNMIVAMIRASTYFKKLSKSQPLPSDLLVKEIATSLGTYLGNRVTPNSDPVVTKENSMGTELEEAQLAGIQSPPNSPTKLDGLREKTNNTGLDNTLDALLEYIGDEKVTRNVMKMIMYMRVEEAKPAVVVSEPAKEVKVP